MSEALSALPSIIPIDPHTELVKTGPEHVEDLAQIIEGDPRIPQYVTWASFVQNGPRDVIPALQRRSNEAMDGRYTIVPRGNVAGYGGVFPGEQENEYGLGYFVAKEARGQKLAIKATRALMQATAQYLEVKKFYLQIAEENHPSIAVARELGFQPAELVWDEILNLEERRYRIEVR